MNSSLAHAGHWVGQLLYLVPVIAMVVVVAIGKLRGHGEEDEDVQSPDA